MPGAAVAQQAPDPTAAASEPNGFIPEPGLLTRFTVFVDRQFSNGDRKNGPYVDFGNMPQSAGWLTPRGGYRHWYAKDSVFLDASAGASTNRYRRAQLRLELPRVAKGRVVLGTQARWQRFPEVRFFEAGSNSAETALNSYNIGSSQLAAYASLKPARWMSLTADGSLVDSTVDVAAPAFHASQNFRTVGLTALADTRDFPLHPTRGAVIRLSAARFNDRDGGAPDFDQYEGEIGGFIPIAGARAVLALHGWVAGSQDSDFVPFYLQPSLGGANTLRSFADYRFRDRNMLVSNLELRLAMMTHADLAFFADAGNVAPRYQDLNLDKRSYGAGLRFHNRRQTYLVVDVARGTEGWRGLVRLTDPLGWPRLFRRTVDVPFAP